MLPADSVMLPALSSNITPSYRHSCHLHLNRCSPRPLIAANQALPGGLIGCTEVLPPRFEVPPPLRGLPLAFSAPWLEVPEPAFPAAIEPLVGEVTPVVVARRGSGVH